MTDQAPGFIRINPVELKERLDRQTDLLIIDVLPDVLFHRQHLPGAINACVYEVAFPEHIADITRDAQATLVVYGAGGFSLDAVTAADKLIRLGFEHVLVLEGGLPAWGEAGFPVEGEQQVIQDPHQFPPYLEEDRTYTVDVHRSFIEWAGRNANITHIGTVALSDGFFTVQDGRIKGEFGIDMTSIQDLDLVDQELNRTLVYHLNSDDFFWTLLFPKAVFILNSATPVAEYIPGKPNYHVEGNLGLRGLSGPLSFPATVDNLGGGELVIEAHFDFDRTRFGVIYGSGSLFKHLDYHLVWDDISVRIRLTAL